MEKISGLVLDCYDDPDGEILRTVFPDSDDVPDLIKQAHAITSEEASLLPDYAYALILECGDVELKKFATVDAGNTALSVEYFLQTRDRLPAEAQKVAATNLVAACEWFDIEPPEELQKVAIGLIGAGMGALVLPGAVSEAKKNLQAANTGPEGVVMTPAQIKARRYQMGL